TRSRRRPGAPVEMGTTEGRRRASALTGAPLAAGEYRGSFLAGGDGARHRLARQAALLEVLVHLPRELSLGGIDGPEDQVRQHRQQQLTNHQGLSLESFDDTIRCAQGTDSV